MFMYDHRASSETVTNTRERQVSAEVVSPSYTMLHTEKEVQTEYLRPFFMSRCLLLSLVYLRQQQVMSLDPLTI